MDKRKTVENEVKLNLSSDSDDSQIVEKNDQSKCRNKITSLNSNQINDSELSQQSTSKKSKRNLSSDSNDDYSDRVVKKKKRNENNQKNNETFINSIYTEIKDTKQPKENNTEKPVEFSSVVAAFYNSVNTEFSERSKSRIYYLRNFNNWIKTCIIDECVEHLKEQQYSRKLNVLDMCCGKGGDLIKWLMSRKVKHLVLADIADVSLSDCRRRIDHLKIESEIRCETILADCTKVNLRALYKDPSIKFDIVSCQFSFHYCFESLPQAKCMLHNATDCLRPGGLFLGTLPNANQIVKRLKKKGTKRLSNDVFSLEMISPEPYALFGAKYTFKLEEVVDCPEFLVHFPTFEKLASNFGLKLLKRRSFDEVYFKERNTERGRKLLKKMKALETYPPFEGKELNGSAEEYSHMKMIWGKEDLECRKLPRLGTLSKSEWEVITMYDIFIFEKQKT